MLRASSGQLRAPKLPPESDLWVEHVRVPEFSAPSRRPTPPPPPRLTVIDRAQRVIAELERAGPGLEDPGVQALLRLGPEALPAVAEAFPGLLWFNRRHPHSGVARGRDVSPIARALVAFGAASVPYVKDAMQARHPDLRYYALLVALELPPDELVEPIALAALDPDIGIRAVAADAELSFDEARTRACCRVWRSVLRQGAEMRPHLVYAVHAVARVRDQGSARALVALLGTIDDEVDNVACRALSVLTGQVFGYDADLWGRWLDKHEKHHRIEWLIDGVAGCAPAIYGFVLSELVEASGERLGEAAVDDRRARKKLAKAYRRWWKSTGRT